MNSSPLALHICVVNLNQRWVIVNWTLKNKLHWIFYQYTKLLILEKASEDIVSEMAAILSRRSWVIWFLVLCSYDNDLHLLPKAMPILQTLIFRGLGRLPAPNVEFPWQQNIQIRLLNLTFESIVNEHKPWVEFIGEENLGVVIGEVPISLVTSQLANLQIDLHNIDIAISQTPRNIYR